MNRKGRNIQLGIGAPSIFMLFVILVMCVLAVLSYLKADSFYKSTIRQLDIISSYYQSESQLLDIFYQLDTQHIDQQLADLDVNYIKIDNQYVLEDNINSDIKLQLVFTMKDNHLGILSFQTMNQEDK